MSGHSPSELRHLLQVRLRSAPWWYLVIVTLFLSAGFFAWQANVVQARYQLVVAAKMENSQAQIKRREAFDKAQDPEADKQRAALAAELRFSWDPIFTAVESSSSKDIELLGFEPDRRAQRLTLKGEAKTPSGLTEYLHKLSQQEVFELVHLTRQQLLKHEQLETVGFEIHARLHVGAQ